MPEEDDAAKKLLETIFSLVAKGASIEISDAVIEAKKVEIEPLTPKKQEGKQG